MHIYVHTQLFFFYKNNIIGFLHSSINSLNYIARSMLQYNHFLLWIKMRTLDLKIDFRLLNRGHTATQT